MSSREHMANRRANILCHNDYYFTREPLTLYGAITCSSAPGFGCHGPEKLFPSGANLPVNFASIRPCLIEIVYMSPRISHSYGHGSRAMFENTSDENARRALSFKGGTYSGVFIHAAMAGSPTASGKVVITINGDE